MGYDEMKGLAGLIVCRSVAATANEKVLATCVLKLAAVVEAAEALIDGGVVLQPSLAAIETAERLVTLRAALRALGAEEGT